ncbi:hypothetical protein HMPREF1986_00384 [Oribacterium sp. oral taxon 078 str. F0263]|nr:hypothetical protein HMPREF1986_00384 [Oribacterium sp. oral taxon 078 str. F0263]
MPPRYPYSITIPFYLYTLLSLYSFISMLFYNYTLLYLPKPGSTAKA